MACSRPPGPMTSTFTVSKGTWCTPQAPKLCRPLDMLNFRGRALAGAGATRGTCPVPGAGATGGLGTRGQGNPRDMPSPGRGHWAQCQHAHAWAPGLDMSRGAGEHAPAGMPRLDMSSWARGTCCTRQVTAGHVPRPRGTDQAPAPGPHVGPQRGTHGRRANPRDMSSPGLGHWAQSHHAHVRVPGLDMSRGAGEHAHTRVPRLDMSVALENLPTPRFQDWACPVDRVACPLPGAAGVHAHRPEDRTRRRTIRRARGYEWPV